MNEKVLVEKLKQGNESAFKAIVDTWQNMVYNTALSIVQNEADAEDLAQEVFLQVYQSIHSFKEESKFSTWLYRITVSKALDHERRKKRKKRFGFVKSLFGENSEVIFHPVDFQHPGVKLDNKENATLLFKALRELPENQRVAFVLQKVEGLSYQEVGEAMQTSVSAVESLLHRAKNNLKKILETHYNNQK